MPRSSEEHAANLRRFRAEHPGYNRPYTARWRTAHREEQTRMNREWRQRTGAGKAHSAVRNAIRRGDLVRPDTCSRCGIVGKIEASHDDYARPLDVEWLCRRCHAHKDQGRADASKQ